VQLREYTGLVNTDKQHAGDAMNVTKELNRPVHTFPGVYFIALLDGGVLLFSIFFISS
jgi:hypothetical protein